MHQISLLQQNLNQIAQICNQLSQNEQSNVTKLTQMQQAERTAAQQLQHCAQLCQQVSQQVQQMMSSAQFGNISQQGFVSPAISAYPGTAPVGAGFQGTMSGAGMSTSHWANRPINTAQFGPTGQYGGTAPYQG